MVIMLPFFKPRPLLYNEAGGLGLKAQGAIYMFRCYRKPCGKSSLQDEIPVATQVLDPKLKPKPRPWKS